MHREGPVAELKFKLATGVRIHYEPPGRPYAAFRAVCPAQDWHHEAGARVGFV